MALGNVAYSYSFQVFRIHSEWPHNDMMYEIHFQISDWMVDFHTPGGVDRDGWQYAVDFPASYHAKKNFTDYVRRRRWSVWCNNNNEINSLI